MACIGTAEANSGPPVSLFRQMDFKPRVFGTFGESGTSEIEVIEMAVEYGVEHLGRTITATIVDDVRMALRRRYMTQLSTVKWRGYANLILIGLSTWVPDAWVPTRLKSGQKCRRERMGESLEGCGWLTRRMSLFEMPFPTVGGTRGGTL